MKMQAHSGRVRHIAVIALGAAVYALLYSLGSQIEAVHHTQLSVTLMRFALAYPVALLVLWGFMNVRLPARKRMPPQGKAFFTLGAFALIFLSFVPMFLIEYPGSFMYDTQRQTFQIATGEYDMFHPLAHTLLMRLCIACYGLLGESFERCAAMYSLLSMTFMAGCFALLCASVSRSFGRTAARVTTAFFCLYPAHMAFASNCTKDGPFAACFALFLAHAVEWSVRGQMRRRNVAVWVLAGVLACLLRNNMIYAMAVFAVLMLLLRGNLRRLGALALACCALGYGVNQGLGALLDADDGNIVEMLCVPIQQLARASVHAPQAFDAQDRAVMDAVFAGCERMYEPTLADPVKNRLEEQTVREHMGALAGVYLSVGQRCPGVYLDAFLNLALPSLYPYSRYRVAQPYIEVGMQPGGVFSGPFDQPPMTQPRRFAPIREALSEGLYETGADHIPVVRLLFNCGAIYWLLLALWLRMAYQGDWARFGTLLLAVLLYGTYLLGPVMQGRYTYPFICALPLFAGSAFVHATKHNSKEEL